MLAAIMENVRNFSSNNGPWCDWRVRRSEEQAVVHDFDPAPRRIGVDRKGQVEGLAALLAERGHFARFRGHRAKDFNVFKCHHAIMPSCHHVIAPSC